MTNSKIVIALSNESVYAVAPWAYAGYVVYMIDPLHPKGINSHPLLPNTWTVGAVIAPDTQMPEYPDCLDFLGHTIRTGLVCMVIGFPPCTQLASSGARHWQVKYNEDRYFQARAAIVLEQCRMVGALSGAPWCFENPNGAASSIFGKPQHRFDPKDYGGYLPENDIHPDYADYLPPRDAYTKATNIWCGNGFIIPQKKPVTGLTYYPGWEKLGGKSAKTKRIRSASPRGFFEAVFQANHNASGSYKNN